MPRTKFDRTYPHARLIDSIAHVKHPCMDIIHDFKVIYPLLLEWFDDDLTPIGFQKLTERYNDMKDIPTTPTNITRLYVVTRMTYVPLALFNLDEPILRHIQHCVDHLPYVVEESDYFICDGNCDPSHSVSIFIFKGNDLIFCDERIPLLLLIHLLLAFPKENQIDTSGTRQAFYAEPRRNPERY